MKTTKIFKEILLNEIKVKKPELYSKLISEISKKQLSNLVAKFSAETEDDVTIITSNIQQFENIKNGLPSDKRDLFTYTYDELVDVLERKKTKKQLKKLFSSFKKKVQGTDTQVIDSQLKETLKKYLEIKDALPKTLPSIDKLSYLKLVDIVAKFYESILVKKLLKRFKGKANDDTIKSYIERYIDHYDQAMDETVLATQMDFEEFEHMVDGFEVEDNPDTVESDSTHDIEVVYDKNNLTIFKPKDKEQCIRLRNGRSWCTSALGASNLYYNYRLNKNLTLYYVIDSDRPFDDRFFATVILVSPTGTIGFADKTNSGNYSGTSPMSWDTISGHIPKLKDLQHLFKSDPLTDEEQDALKNLKNRPARTDDIVKEFGGEQRAELWMEINSTYLTPKQFINLPEKLQFKYIALGFALNAEMIDKASPKVINYMLSKKFDSLKDKNLSQFSDIDYALIKKDHPKAKQFVKDNKERFINELTNDSGGNRNHFRLEIPSGLSSKILELYGMEPIIQTIPENIERFDIINETNNDLDIDMGKVFSKCKNLNAVVLINCVSSLPENIENVSDSLMFLSLKNNKKLDTLPTALAKKVNGEYIFEFLTILNAVGCASDYKTPPEIIEMKNELDIEGELDDVP